MGVALGLENFSYCSPALVKILEISQFNLLKNNSKSKAVASRLLRNPFKIFLKDLKRFFSIITAKNGFMALVIVSPPMLMVAKESAVAEIFSPFFSLLAE